MVRTISKWCLLLACAGISSGCASQNIETKVLSSGHFDRLPLVVRNLRDPESLPHERWPLTAGLAAAAVATSWQLDGPDTARWRGGILVDDSVREVLRAESTAGRERASTASDIMRGSLWAWVLTDTALVRGRHEQLQLWQLNLDATLLSGLGQNVTKFSAGRERPNASDNRSFYSGHAASAATAAGLICAHHLSGDLYGGGRGDRLACSGAVALAAATGLARIIADEHYASDVVAGWAAGAAVGYFLPRLWYHAPNRESGTAAISVVPELNHDAVVIHCALRW